MKKLTGKEINMVILKSHSCYNCVHSLICHLHVILINTNMLIIYGDKLYKFFETIAKSCKNYKGKIDREG